MLRINIENDDLEFYQKSKILNIMSPSDRTEQFLIAMAFGYNLGSKTKLNGKKALILEDSIKDNQLALMNIVAIDEMDDIKMISNRKEVFNIVEQYANTGIKFLQKIENTSQYDEELDKFESFVNKEYNRIKFE